MQRNKHVAARTRFRRRGVAIYLLTLMIAMVVTSTAVALLSMQMANRRLNRNITDAQQAELLSQAGLEWALATYQADTSWRSTADSGDDIEFSIAAESNVTVTLSDADDDFENDDADPATLTVAADVYGASYSFTAVLEPAPHETLARAIYATGEVWFWTSSIIKGPVHADDGYWAGVAPSVFDNGGFSTLSSGTVSGPIAPVNVVPPVDPFSTPDLDYYLSRATELTDSDGVFRLDQMTISRTANTQGPINTEGVYLIDAVGRDVVIEDVYLRGTLIILSSIGRNVTFQGGCYFEAGDFGYPTLLIAGRPTNVTFNPSDPLTECLDRGDGGVCDDVALDYNGDGDTDDVFPSGFYGIIWTNGWLTTLAGSGTTYRGSIIAREVDVSGSVTIDDDAGIAGGLVHSFTDRRLHLRRGSILEVTP